MARRFESQKSKLEEDTSPMSSAEAVAEHSGVSEEDVTGSQELLFSERQVPPTRLLENKTLEDISCDPGNIQEPLITMSGPTGPSSTDVAVTTQSSLLPVDRPSQAACESVEGLEQPDVEKREKFRVKHMADSSSSSSKVRKIAVTPQTRGVWRSVTRSTHVTSRPSPRPTASRRASQELTWASPIAWKVSREPTGTNPTTWKASQEPTWANPTAWKAFQEPTWTNPTTWKVSQEPTWANPTAWETPHGSTWTSPTDCEAPQGSTWTCPTAWEAPHGSTWTCPTAWEAPHGSTWTSPTDSEAPHGSTWTSPTDCETSHGSTWVNPIDWKASQDPILINPANLGPSQGLVKADCNVSTYSRERIGVFLREGELRFWKKVPQSAVTQNLLYCQIRFPMRKGSLVTIFSVTESGLFKAGEELYVCEKFLMGTCQNDSSCLHYHILLPFHWQFHHKYNNRWYSVPLGTQMHLEMIHANPNYAAAKIMYLGKILYLDMNLKIFQSSSPSCFDYARRICCKSDSPFTPSSEVYWHNGYKWVPYDQESGNPSSNLQNPDGTKTQLEEMYLLKTSRPKYVPLYQNVNQLRIWHSEVSKTLSLWGEEATDIYIGDHPYKNQVKMLRRDFFTVVEIAPSEPAYQYCCQLFHDSIPPEQAVVLRIYRLYNPYFWMLYQREKRRLKRLQIPSPLEYHLFCQTPISLEELTKYGLCPKTRGTEGILGRGLYFSLNASVLSSQKTVNSGHMTVLAKVLIGEKTLGNYLFNSAPCKEDGYEYDACVNDMNMPTLFTVFRKELTYPYFIIFYKCIEDLVHLVY